jgi:hypothetical protein
VSRPTRKKAIVIGVFCTLLAVLVIHEAFPRRSGSLKAWADLITRTRPGEVLASSESHGHYVAIEQTTDGRAIVWIRHPAMVGDMRTATMSMNSLLGSVYDDNRPEGNETVRLSPSWITGDAKNGDGVATPIKGSISGDVEFGISEEMGCADLLAYRATVSWR